MLLKKKQQIIISRPAYVRQALCLPGRGLHSRPFLLQIVRQQKEKCEFCEGVYVSVCVWYVYMLTGYTEYFHTLYATKQSRGQT